MPAKTEKQRRFLAMDLARVRAGQKSKTGMSESQLREFARKPVANQATAYAGSEPAGEPMFLDFEGKPTHKPHLRFGAIEFDPPMKDQSHLIGIGRIPMVDKGYITVFPDRTEKRLNVNQNVRITNPFDIRSPVKISDLSPDLHSQVSRVINDEYGHFYPFMRAIMDSSQRLTNSTDKPFSATERSVDHASLLGRFGDYLDDNGHPDSDKFHEHYHKVMSGDGHQSFAVTAAPLSYTVGSKPMTADECANSIVYGTLLATRHVPPASQLDIGLPGFLSTGGC